MTDERDPKLQSAYRALGAEEPPRALDEAILAAAEPRPARSWTRRWSVPLSLAAVVVLSVVVTLRIQHEQPGIEQPAPARDEARVAQQAAGPVKPAAQPAARAPEPKSVARKEAEAFPHAPQDRAVAQSRAGAAAPAPARATKVEAPALAKRADQVAPPAAESAAAPALRAVQRDRLAAERVAATPEQELERIAGLRKQGEHDEADKALAEFRKRHPDFKIPPAMLERVERR